MKNQEHEKLMADIVELIDGVGLETESVFVDSRMVRYSNYETAHNYQVSIFHNGRIHQYQSKDAETALAEAVRFAEDYKAGKFNPLVNTYQPIGG